LIELKGFFTKLTLDPGRYTKTLDKSMNVQLRQAARAWLRAVILKVPVWTGMSRGSLRPLGAFLRVAVPISPVASRKNYGIQAGANASAFKFSKEGTKYIFEFDEGVLHYTINEFYNVKPPINLITPGPYGSFKAGELAFQTYVTDVLPGRLPRLEDIITTNRIVVRS